MADHYRNARAAERRGVHGTYRGKPKTRAGEDRAVDLDSLTVEVLRVWREQQLAERTDFGREYLDPYDEHGPLRLVFTRQDGSPLNPTIVGKESTGLARQAGLPHLKFHGLRHFAISLQLEAGVDVTVIAMRVGHTSPALIRRVYGHLIGTVGKRAAETNAALIPRKVHQKRPTRSSPSLGRAAVSSRAGGTYEAIARLGAGVQRMIPSKTAPPKTTTVDDIGH